MKTVWPMSIPTMPPHAISDNSEKTIIILTLIHIFKPVSILEKPIQKRYEYKMHIHYEKKYIIALIILFICLSGSVIGWNRLWLVKSDTGRQLIFTEDTYGAVISKGDTIEQDFLAEDTYLESVLVLASEGAEDDKITVTLSDDKGHELSTSPMKTDITSGMLKADFHKKLEAGSRYHISISFEEIENVYSIYYVPTEDLPEIYGSCSVNGTTENAALFVWFDYKFFRQDLLLLFVGPVLVLIISLIINAPNAAASRFLEGAGTLCCSLLCITAVNYLGTPISKIGSISMLGKAWLITVLLLFLLIGLFTVLTRRLGIGILLSLSVCYLYGLIAHFVLLFRGTPFLPIDILAIKTAKEVASNYNYALDDTVIFAGISYLITVLFCSCVRTKISISTFKRVVMATILCTLCILSGTSWFARIVRLTPDYYSQEDGIKRYGSLLNFIANIRSCFREKPDGYSIDRMQEIAGRYQGDEWDMAEKLPNLIVIMNESWADINISGGLGGAHSDSYMPNIERLSESGDAFSGNVVIPTFGGNTNKSEFAFLTGSVISFGLTGSSYDLDCQEGTASMVSALKDLGYYTVALHPAYSKNWNRDIGYEKLGFDQFYSLEDLSDYKFEYLRSYNYVSDSSLYEVIYDLTDNEAEGKPIFIFCVTIQNHGGYNDSSYTPTVDIEDPQTAQYLSLVKETDQAFAQLVDHYRFDKAETVVLMFGDHMPPLDNIEKLLTKGSLEYYTTPYIIWSNSRSVHENGLVIPYCSVNYLQAYFFEAAGLPLTGFQKFLKETSLKYPIINGGKYYDNQKNPYYLSRGELPEEIMNYQYIQYNNLFDSSNQMKKIFSERVLSK